MARPKRQEPAPIEQWALDVLLAMTRYSRRVTRTIVRRECRKAAAWAVLVSFVLDPERWLLWPFVPLAAWEIIKDR